MLQVNHISYQVQGRPLLTEVSAAIRPGALTALMGSNGAGKSTLLKLISGALQPSAGHITWQGKAMKDWDQRALARTRAVLRQQYSVQLPFSVFDIIAMGRYPHFRSKLTEQCRNVIAKVAAYTGTEQLLNRNYLTLSGGEQQRVQLARVLAQVWDTPSDQKLVLLDEPVSALDIQYQHQLLALVKGLTQAQFTVIAVLHDLNLAMQYADDVLLLKAGRTVRFAAKEEALDAPHIYETFGVKAALHQAEDYPHPFITVCPVHQQYQQW
ncbi:heme ABC transporter ATP-binding protein [Taibaiella helva]|uniref:heme ABC transporter ATP-binding protein n=1 Tax=Taibaiella helva TaxID=2301235 RepID=UPI000E56B657|nr:heme ABC transporter ATP-binding protein [Taibaiella helva]